MRFFFWILRGLVDCFCYTFFGFGWIVWGIIRVILWFIFGWFLPKNNPKPESGVGNIISLLQVIIAGIITLKLSLIKKDSDYELISKFYLAANLIPFMALIFILNASTKKWWTTLCCVFTRNNKNLRHYYSNNTIYIGRLVLIGCAILVVFCYERGRTNNLFNRPDIQRPLKIEDAVKYKPEKEKWQGMASVKVVVPIDEKMFADLGGIPNEFPIKATLLGDLGKLWTITNMKIRPADETSKEDLGYAHRNADTDNSKEFSICGMKTEGNYKLDIFLLENSLNKNEDRKSISNEKKINDAIEMIKKDQDMRVEALNNW